ncbi:MAG TPA: winged helix DNA-binding domain-containing protein [Candidatus Dormibacteraeota bacterium]|nr:winged helix DNA-binding domain-containing protein [Candidatus Dormibacteraeota bacterium]
MEWQYSEWDQTLQNLLKSFQDLMGLFNYLLLMAAGDVDRVFKWMKYLQERGSLDPGVDLDEFRRQLEELAPGVDVRALAYGVRTHVPLVQEPSARAAWGYPGNPRFVTAEAWLGQPIPETLPPHDLILRYLAAFGPARAVDVQAWAGLPPLRAAFDELRGDLIELRDERGNRLVDLPDAPRPAADAPAPPRFLPEFDNLLLAWKDRSRVIADEHRPRIMASPVLMRPTFLVDGFVAGTWKLERDGPTARLRVEPFAALSAHAGEALATEGRRLAAFLAPEAGGHDVSIDESPV